MALLSPLLVLAALCTAAAAAAPGTFDVTAYGGNPDGTTLNTAAFAAAVAAAHLYYARAGAPATVLAPGPGTYLSGQIVLQSGVTLAVAPGARLLASANQSHYPASSAAWAFLYARGAQDIGVTGGGVVDGQYEAYIGGFNATNDEFVFRGWPVCPGGGECRPRLALFQDSQRIAVSSVAFVGSPDWTFHLLNCSYVHVFNWTQRGDERWPNNDVRAGVAGRCAFCGTGGPPGPTHPRPPPPPFFTHTHPHAPAGH
jgi:polygalacturonase